MRPALPLFFSEGRVYGDLLGLEGMRWRWRLETSALPENLRKLSTYAGGKEQAKQGGGGEKEGALVWLLLVKNENVSWKGEGFRPSWCWLLVLFSFPVEEREECPTR